MSEDKELQEYNGMKVGSIITTYHAGYWRLARIERRWYGPGHPIPSFLKGRVKAGDEMSPLFHYTALLDSNFNIAQGHGKRTKCCDGNHCHRVTTKLLREQVKQLQKSHDILRNFLPEEDR